MSEWEDELFEGRDSFLGLVIDAGLRLRYEPESLPGFAPYAGVAYTISGQPMTSRRGRPR